ncbi:MAG: FAD:protein FMN transferase [Alistipes sp.]|nr:FAD:protein FMN transferase [Alistipes sp.]MBR2628139.1 FAD:protein FMN transferase [Alistipes sp.]
MAEISYSRKNPDYPIVYAMFGAMHTRVELLAVGLGEEQGRGLMAEAEREVKRLERLFNRFDSRSPLAVVNMTAIGQSVKVDDELFMALELCEVFRRATAGYFDVTAADDGVDAVSDGSGGYALDGKEHSVRILREGARIDLGGFAKGYAAESVRRIFEQADVRQAVINFGNSSIVAMGHHPYGEWWPIGIEHRKVKSAVAREVKLKDGAMSVSGRADSGEYHIIDPMTGNRAVGEELIVVEGRSALVAEMLSTALYAAPRNRRAAIMAQYEGYVASEIYCRADGTTECREIGKMKK